MATRARRRKDQPWNPPSSGPDISTVFVLFAAGPLLLPVVGANAATLSRGIAISVMAFAALGALGASRRAPERRRAWLAVCAAAIVGIAGSLSGMAADLGWAPGGLRSGLGGLAALGLLAGVAMLAFQSLRGIRLDQAVDALLLGLVAVGAGVYMVAIPGFRDGSVLTTTAFVVDLVAVFAASLSVVASEGSRRRMTLSLLGAAWFITAGHAIVTLTFSGAISLPAGVSTLVFAGAAACIGVAARFETGRPATRRAAPEGDRWLYARVIAPLAAVLAFPAMGLAVWAARGLDHWELAYFGTLSALLLALAFGRQARLLVDNHGAMTRERGLREEVMRRNEDLEAVTGLATTMTQTLDETPIVERGLEVLHLAAHATSSALTDGGRAHLLACAGDWNRDRIWLDGIPEPDGAGGAVSRRGGREIVQLPLAARGSAIGTVTVMRAQPQPFGSAEVDLLRVLADQLAIAIQNARDYREKLEQAVRDPLTGLYNRRYFFEALEKEVHRARRYGSHASLVIFDVDDFKQINDTLGHSAGDEALRKIAEIMAELIREVDSVARIGGEEFALLLPQAQQLDALLVAERVRTAISRAGILADRRVTVSGGVSSCPHDAVTREALEQKADAALYWAKRNGKNICALSSEATEHAMEMDADGMLAHLTALVSVIDGGSQRARDHSENVAAYAVTIAQELGLDADRITQLRRAGLLHDIGKIAVPSAILTKPAALDPDEYERVKLHAAVGATMLLHAGLELEAAWVRAHHERLDGLGYPDGLAGGQIPLEARILLVADAFEAMTSDRLYRDGRGVDAAVEELRACAGTQFDPDVVEALVRLHERENLDVLALRAAGDGD
ncbi:MAG: diguanylate cyclase [Thermoleophilaceae bacterium]